MKYLRSAMEKNYLTTEKYYLPSDIKRDAIKLDLRQKCTLTKKLPPKGQKGYSGAFITLLVKLLLLAETWDGNGVITKQITDFVSMTKLV